MNSEDKLFAWQRAIQVLSSGLYRQPDSEVDIMKETTDVTKPDAHTVLDDVLTILRDDYYTLGKCDAERTKVGIARAIYLIEEYKSKHIV